MNLKIDPALVFAAAAQTESRGETTSIRKVIAEIGYGSPNQIGLLLQERRHHSSREQQTAMHRINESGRK